MKRMVVPVAVLLAALAGGAPAQEKPCPSRANRPAASGMRVNDTANRGPQDHGPDVHGAERQAEYTRGEWQGPSASVQKRAPIASAKLPPMPGVS